MATRYNFTIHAKVKVGRLIGMSFTTGYFAGDTEAIAFGIFLESILANYAKVSVSKVIWEAANNEIPATHTIQDTNDVNFLMVNSSDAQKQCLLTIPGTKMMYMADLETLNIYNENGELMDSIYKMDVTGKNVIEGGHV